MTPFVWMFIKNYEKLRSYMINNKSISSLIQLEYSAFSEATVPICTFVLSNFDENYAGTYLKLSEFTGGMDVQKEKVLQIIAGDEVLNDKNKYIIKQNNFDKIPGSPIAYWADNNLIACFNNTKLESIGDIKVGLQTGENNRFLRYWFEVDFNKIGFSSKTCAESEKSGKKWFPYNKGGDYRKWYGNQEYIVNWEKNGYEIRNIKGSNGRIRSRAQNTQFYFNESLSWSKISSGNIAFRYYPSGFIFDVAGCSVFLNDNLTYIFGFLNSKVCGNILDLISPTLNYEVGHISSLPIIIDESKKDEIENLVLNNIEICRNDWNENEFSWNFKNHPLIEFKDNLIEKSYKKFVEHKKYQFNQVKENEIKLNKLFAEIYNVNIDCDIENKNVSISLLKREEVIKSFISYSVGCMFGRYSLDNKGLQFAGTKFDLNNYHKFIPDDDNIIPILDSEYFEDDIVGKFIEFVKICFGEVNVEENIDFIGNCISKSNISSRDKIRNYFLKNFFTDHKNSYNKRPIYGQFSSGKENGFNCLIYMHRYEPSLVARIRTDYLHKTQKAIEQSIANCDNIINHSSSNSEITKATKDKNKLQKQLKETQEYDEALAHIANQNIEIDLDDGVKVNYAKFQNVEVSKEGKKSKKINLLKKL